MEATRKNNVHAGDGEQEIDTEKEAFCFTSHSVLSTDSERSEDKNDLFFFTLKVN